MSERKCKSMMGPQSWLVQSLAINKSAVPALYFLFSGVLEKDREGAADFPGRQGTSSQGQQGK